MTFPHYQATSAARKLAQVIPVLQTMKVQSVSILLSSHKSPDYIKSIDFFPLQTNDPEIILDGQQYTLSQALTNIVGDHYEMTGIDWFYDDDGGEGHFNIDLLNNLISFELKCFVIEKITAYADEWSVHATLEKSNSPFLQSDE